MNSETPRHARRGVDESHLDQTESDDDSPTLRAVTTVAVLGAGNVGRALAAAWAAAGHQVRVAVRNPQGAAVAAMPIAEALDGVEVVLLAIPGGSVPALLREHRAALDGAIVIDATNDFGSGHASTTLASLDVLAEGAPSALGYRAFNSVGWENMANPVVAGERSSLFYAGPEVAQRSIVERLVADVGFEPVYVGAGEDAHRAVDALATLWFALAFGQRRGRRLALRLLHER